MQEKKMDNQVGVVIGREGGSREGDLEGRIARIPLRKGNSY